MISWGSAALKDLVTDAKAGFACGEESADGVFQFRMNNVGADGTLDYRKKRRVPKDIRGLDRALLEPGDVLFNATNSPELVGKSAFFNGHDEPAAFSNHLLRLRTKPATLDGRYLARWMSVQFQRGVFRGMCRQWVNQASVSREALLAMTVPLPPLSEQRRIADILDRADALRAKRRAALALLDTLTQSIFLEMFGDPATNDRGWPSGSTLGDVADVASGVTKGRKLGSPATRSVPYLAVSNVQDMRLDLNVVKSIEASDAEIERFRLESGDLLLTEGGDPDKLGRGTLWQGQLTDCIHQNHIFRVRVTSNALAPVFLNWLVSSSRGKRYFLRSAKQTTGIASINMTQLRGFPLLLPPLSLQQEFALEVAAVNKLKAAHRSSLGESDALFASLQHRAFRGEL